LAFLGEVAASGAYEDVKVTADAPVIDGMEIAVLSLVGLIKSKKAAGRLKDLCVLPELEALEQIERKTGAK